MNANKRANKSIAGLNTAAHYTVTSESPDQLSEMENRLPKRTALAASVAGEEMMPQNSQDTTAYYLADNEVGVIVTDHMGGSDFPKGCIAVISRNVNSSDDGSTEPEGKGSPIDRPAQSEDGNEYLLVTMKRDGTEISAVRTILKQDGFALTINLPGTDDRETRAKDTHNVFNIGKVLKVVGACFPPPINENGARILSPQYAPRIQKNPGNLLYTGPGNYEMDNAPRMLAGVYRIEPDPSFPSTGTWFRISADGIDCCWAPDGYLENYLLRRVA